jgi:protein O-GlcNAc transferase
MQAKMSLNQAMELAMQQHQAGRLAEAEQIYRQVLANAPNHAGALHGLGLLSHQAGKHSEAADLIAQAIAIQPVEPMFHCNLGNVLSAMREYDRAIEAYQRAVALNPNLAEPHNNLGNALQSKGFLDDAATELSAAIRLKPDLAEAHANLGTVHRRQGKVDEAIAALSRAIELKPDFAVAHNRLGEIFLEQRLFGEAAEAFSRAVEVQPRYLVAINNLGIALKEQGRLDEAIAAYRRGMELAPDSPALFQNLGNALRNQGKFPEAIAAFKRAIALQPKYAEAHSALADSLILEGKAGEALTAASRAVELDPARPIAHNNLGNALMECHRLDEAMESFKRAIELKPDFAEAYGNLANALKDEGRVAEAIGVYDRALAVNPYHSTIASNRVYALHFHPDYDAPAILREHREWNRLYAQKISAYPAHANDRDANRPLRVGYVSADFRTHPVGRFLLPLFRHHDPRQVDIFCYSNVTAPDAMTDQLRRYAREWKSIVAISDESAAEMIYRDQIDILVDLAMHAAGNRMLLFARKPAPMQVTYLAYCSTTGLEAMDYRLTDPHIDPPGEGDENFSEKSVRLAHTYWCYEPPQGDGNRYYAPSPSPGTPGEGWGEGSSNFSAQELSYMVAGMPEPGDLPASAAGRITFGSLNNFCKVSEPALRAWAEILRGVPRSRLMLHAKEGSHRNEVLRLLAEYSVETERVEFIGVQASADYFRSYRDIDIALDPFPCAGGTTTCDALWMGVPVVTLAGRTAVGRTGVSILSVIGLPELIASDVAQYVRIAIELAEDFPRLEKLRAGLRELMLRSPLCDAGGFARDVEAAYRQMWRDWCQR